MIRCNVFTDNSVELHHLKNLTEAEIKELLPKVGERQELKDAIKRKFTNVPSPGLGQRKRAVVNLVRHFLLGNNHKMSKFLFAFPFVRLLHTFIR